MIFPFSVRFNNQLKAIITSKNQQQILEYISLNIIEKKADNVIIGDYRVTYKGSTSKGRGSLFGGVDDGSFDLSYKNAKWYLIYQINMRKLFINTLMLSVIAETFVLFNRGPWWIGLVAFLWLCGGNWIIYLIRHGLVVGNLTIQIDELICGKMEQPEKPELEKIPGKLKSWF
ncbi:hypothetical protein [Mucilaginibacter sp. dw_454]|uniref:hypothetical protein n=1 Tax=Mucilaginibacter sp. dw_454 TaxID=2720079 RepID=UPI001BD5D67C|nr:hypothetical protein [Mucilaginibacter sp. dw_454]